MCFVASLFRAENKRYAIIFDKCKYNYYTYIFILLYFNKKILRFNSILNENINKTMKIILYKEILKTIE